MFYVIAALFLSVGFALFLATRPRKPQTQAAKPAASTAPSSAGAARAKTAAAAAGALRAKRAGAAAPEPARAEARATPRMKLHRRGRHADETTPQRISREAYLRELAERTRIMQEQQHPSETQNH